MIIPVRCFTCGKVIGHLYEQYKRRIDEMGEAPKEVMDSLGLKNYCCRRIFVAHVNLIDEIMRYD